MRYKPFILLLLIVSLMALPALAAGNAPASQFGFRGWPYRQQTPCNSAAPTAAPQIPATEKPQATLRPISTAAPRPTARPSAASSTSTGDYTTLSVTAQEQKLLDLLNQDRRTNSLPALALDAELSRIARIKSADMRDQGYFAHESPTYGNAASMLAAFGYAFRGVGENIAHHASVEKAEAAFLSSPGHRTNLMGSQWQRVGIGVCFDKNGFVYVTQLFVR